VSTRKHGFVRKSFPVVDQFNATICKLEMDGGVYLLDATDRFLPFGLLPERCLNGEGWVISEEGSGWIKLQSNALNSTLITIEANLLSSGTIEGSLERQFGGYAGRKERIKFYNDSLEYKKDLQKVLDAPKIWKIRLHLWVIRTNIF